MKKVFFSPSRSVFEQRFIALTLFCSISISGWCWKIKAFSPARWIRKKAWSGKLYEFSICCSFSLFREYRMEKRFSTTIDGAAVESKKRERNTIRFSPDMKNVEIFSPLSQYLFFKEFFDSAFVSVKNFLLLLPHKRKTKTNFRFLFCCLCRERRQSV